jgi:NAD(P)-dependent dehydrogenase (short-subunit alcohol dehydrogenase family)
MKNLAGKVAVVTGAASGIGRCLAEAFVAAGMKVVLADVEASALEATARALADAGGDVLAVESVLNRGLGRLCRAGFVGGDARVPVLEMPAELVVEHRGSYLRQLVSLLI